MNSDRLLFHLAIWPSVALIVFIFTPFIYTWLRNIFSTKDDE